MKLGFVTCVQIGLSCMEAIYEIGGKLDIAITLKDEKAKNKSGRVYLDRFCQDNSIELYKIEHINEDVVIKLIHEFQLDWLFIIGWSQIANRRLLDSPKKGVLGMHPSLLPKGRGRAAIPWAIIKGLDETGVTLFKLDEGVDTGPILSQYKIPLDEMTNATDLYHSVNDAHIHLMKDIIPQILEDTATLQTQNEDDATFCDGRKPEDGELDISMSVSDAEKLVRATTKPYPGAFIYIDGKKNIIWAARVTDDINDNFYLEFHDGILECTEWEQV